MNRKKVGILAFLLIYLFCVTAAASKVQAAVPVEEPTGLYGQSAVLMDAESGRVLYEKEGSREMPMASTTKIMTCLVALERADQDLEVTVSANAAAQPDVQMNIREGERYRLGDLLRGMMLESFNDVAVAVAEAVGQNVENFAVLMNERAESLGCTDTHFVTPNGLDASDGGGEHHTTAHDLALILSAAIHNEEFLAITQTGEFTVTELDGKRTVTAHNKNALLQNTKGAISGKTGFTGKAGYCYAGAVQRDERTLVAVSLASGWPPHKEYKWQDMQKLFGYGFDYFHYRTASAADAQTVDRITVKNGKVLQIGETAQTLLNVPDTQLRMLIRDDEELSVSADQKSSIWAPAKKGTTVGWISFLLEGETVEQQAITVSQAVDAEDYPWDIYRIFCYFFHVFNQKMLKLNSIQAIID